MDEQAEGSVVTIPITSTGRALSSCLTDSRPNETVPTLESNRKDRHSRPAAGFDRMVAYQYQTDYPHSGTGARARFVALSQHKNCEIVLGDAFLVSFVCPSMGPREPGEDRARAEFR